MEDGTVARRAAQVVAIARRRDEPALWHAFADGELAVDQVATVVTRAPARADAEMCEFARHATVSQLRTVAGRYPFDPPAAEPPPAIQPLPAGQRRVQVDRCTFFVGDDGRQRDAGAVRRRGGAPADCLSEASRRRRRRISGCRGGTRSSTSPVEVSTRSTTWRGATGSKTYLHVPVDRCECGRSTDSAALPDAIRRYLTCDGAIQPVWGARQRAVRSRARHPHRERTKRIVRHRDQGCRVPGCTARRWLDIHHIVHWEDGGATETGNLVCLCGFHHRLHHRGQLDIRGDADSSDQLTFVNGAGLELHSGPRPRPPTGRSPPSRLPYSHPLGERLDYGCVYFNPPRME